MPDQVEVWEGSSLCWFYPPPAEAHFCRRSGEIPVDCTHYDSKKCLNQARKQALRAGVESPWAGQERQPGGNQGPAGKGGSDGHPPSCSPLQTHWNTCRCPPPSADEEQDGLREKALLSPHAWYLAIFLAKWQKGLALTTYRGFTWLFFMM